MPSTGEWMVLLVLGLLIFGRRLPEVGRSVARTLTQFRRGLNDFKREMDKNEDLKDVKSTLKDMTTEVKKAVEAPRIMANPGKLLETLGGEEEEVETSPAEVSSSATSSATSSSAESSAELSSPSEKSGQEDLASQEEEERS